MTEQLTKANLNEMLVMCYMSQDGGWDKIQMDVEHAVEIITRLLDMTIEEENR